MSVRPRFGHVGITVPDIEEATSWYQEVLGCELLMGPVDVSTEDAALAPQLRDVFARERVVFRQSHLLLDGGIALELFEFEEPATGERPQFEFWRVGPFHICLVTPAIEELAAAIERTGGRRRTEIRPIFPEEHYRFCYCEDPYGNIIELASHPHAESFGGRSGYSDV